MALKWEGYSSDPAANSAPPPVGAPEGATRNKQVNDILRYVMAAIHELGDWVKTETDALGTISVQNKDAISITGGTISNTSIGSSNSIHGGAIKSGTIDNDRLEPRQDDSQRLGGYSLQQVYDFIRPVGDVMLKTNDPSTINVPAGVAATWARIDNSRFMKILSSANYTGSVNSLQVGGNNNPTTTGNGGHDHGGFTLNHTLTIAQIPNHDHDMGGGLQATGQSTGYRSEATVQNSASGKTGKTGGGAAHQHALNNEPDHAHQVSVDPAWVAFIAWRRIA